MTDFKTFIPARTALAGVDTASDDVFPIIDTSASATKKITRAEAAIALSKDFGPAIDAATAKTTLVAADEIMIADSAVSFATKKATLSNLQSMLKLAGFPYVLAQTSVPSGIAPSGTMGANGAVTLGTALGLTYSGGIWLYFPAGAVYSGSAAGNYWCVMSSTTAGTVYNEVLGAAWPTIPSAPAAVSDAGPGAYTGTTIEVTLATFTVPGNALGLNGTLRETITTSYTNSAGAKTLKSYFGGWLYGNNANSTVLNDRRVIEINNIGVANKQRGGSSVAGLYVGTTSELPVSTVNTTSDVTCAIKGTLAAATDYMALSSARIDIICAG